jgi:hypothetical protein
MPGSPEAVQTLPPSRSQLPGSTGAGQLAETVVPPKPEPRPSSGVSKVAWVPREDLGQSEWLATGRRLGAIGRCSQWWIGDWIRYGTARWGEKYAEAARVTGYDVASLRNMAWVAAQFDLSLRSDKLSWSHHVLLAPLNAEEQRYWIEKAADARLSVADLRLELRTWGHGSRRGQATAGAEDEGRGEGICPHCGHKLGGAPGSTR